METGNGYAATIQILEKWGLHLHLQLISFTLTPLISLVEAFFSKWISMYWNPMQRKWALDEISRIHIGENKRGPLRSKWYWFVSSEDLSSRVSPLDKAIFKKACGNHRWEKKRMVAVGVAFLCGFIVAVVGMWVMRGILSRSRTKNLKAKYCPNNFFWKASARRRNL